ncbi:SDR family NAD(P)-dependent oxidoreductase [Micromonospora parathelypteridis]|uniref:Short-subunit dehydrogenase n=1 Tax=Micromonospora parathelypteridis TaxID=1839617 RepID=A0A840W5C3_9ACTN|nr:SDR family NAD(P)-dependent oxidoreductase [Micromonospora parathelypteridis]MBB5480278.1 short-subunit dehydrogenase [Micromonospora parathelypteridis]GGO24106.1 short-chain dehydrogenase [Micromonospora parathelypteridis]
MSRVVVIVGASSGVGRATARAFAERGDRLVLAARATTTLAEVRAECADADVLTVPTDVTEPGALEALAGAAIDHFGGVDVWVHTAAVMAYGRFDELPGRVFDQVVRTDLLGTADSVRVALRHFRAAGAGTIVLTGSLLGHVTAPYMSAYVTSKWGLQGLARTVQQELRDSPRIRLCLVNPGSVDTPVYQQAANYLGRVGRPPPPVTSPQRVARAIVNCVDRPRREVSVGRLNVVLRAGFTVLPGVYDMLVGPLMRVAGLSGRPVAAQDGSVFTPNPAGEAVRGGHLPDLRQLVFGPLGAVGAALRRRLG